MKTFLQVNLLLCVSGLFFILLERVGGVVLLKMKARGVLRFAQIVFLSAMILPLVMRMIPEKALSGARPSAFQVYSDEMISSAPMAQAKIQAARVVTTTAEVARDEFKMNPSDVLFYGWCLGVFFYLGKFLLNFLRIQRFLKRAIVHKSYGKLRIVVSDSVFVPFSVRFLKLWIVLPKSLLANQKDMELAIKHEIQHHRQGDCLWAMLQEGIGCFFFFNPAYIWWKNIITEQQEYACDEALTGQSAVLKHEYGSCLIRVAETALKHRQMYVGTTSMAAIIKDSTYFKKFLLRRIEMITEEKATKRTWLAGLGALMLGTLTVGMAIGAEKISRGMHSGINPGKVSVDTEIQKIADDALMRALSRMKATAGFVLVSEPGTGRVLAIANVDLKSKRASHWAISELMESASIAKPLMIAKAFEAGVTTPDEKQNCEKGSFNFHGQTYRDWKGGGWKELTTTEAVEVSSNICNIKIAEKVGEAGLLKMLEDFGFGHDGTAEKFPEARVGQRPNPGPQFIPQVAVGFGFRSSPLEVLAAYGALANGGELMAPVGAKAAGGKSIRRVMSQENSRKIRELLMNVVKNGTGKKAESDLYTTAGKTATSYLNDFVNTDWDKNHANYAGFIGFAPVSSPRVEVFVGLINPNTDGTGAHGGAHAAPVFKEVVENVLTHMKVAPDKI